MNQSAVMEKTDEYEELDFDELERVLQEDLEAEMSDLEFMNEQFEQIGNPETLGQVVLDTVWEQFTNQIAVQAGEDFIKNNNGLHLDLRNEAHIQTTDNFDKGEIASHNTITDYKSRYDEVRADFQTDPNMEVKMSKNMRYDKERKTYERYDKKKGWIGKTRYNDETKVWEDWDSKSNSWKKKLAPDARKNFDTRDKSQKGTKNDAKDHVISVGEQLRDMDAATHMDRGSRKKFAKSEINLNDMDARANESKGDQQMVPWLESERDGKKPAERFPIDEEELRKRDKEAREEYEKQKKEAEERSKKEGRKSQRKEAVRLGAEALKAVIMSLLADLVKSIIQKLVSWLKSSERHLKSLVEQIKNAVVSFVRNIKNKVAGMADTAATVIVTSIWGPVGRTIKSVWTFLKTGWRSLKEAIAYIRNPENKKKPIGAILAEVSKIVVAGMTAGGAILLGDIIEKGLMAVPVLAFEIPLLGSLASIIGLFMGAVISGIIGALAINLINRLVARKQKASLDMDRIDKRNEILTTQNKLLSLNSEKLANTKENVISNIAERHEEAATMMKESLEEIFKDSDEDYYREVDDVKKNIESKMNFLMEGDNL